MKQVMIWLMVLGIISAQGQTQDREFVKNSYYDGTSVLVPENATEEQITELAAMVRPSARQLRWQEYGMLGFLTFNMNVYTGVEWGSGKEDLSIFNPKDLDAHQWIKAFKSAGIQSVILVCKHHDGFTLWPSKYRERTIKNTPYKNGKGDIVREFFDACRAEGIRICVYYSPWDMQEPYGKPEYNDLMINELTELLTYYGDVDLVWFDGAGIDPKVSGKNMDFDWDRIYRAIRELQPQALISGAGPDIRWVGNEGGHGRFTEWSVQGVQSEKADFSGFDSGVPLMAKTLGDISELHKFKQLTWYPARGGLPVRHQWFWHPGQRTRSLQYVIDSYFETVGQNSNLLVNLSPDDRGLVPETDVVLMDRLGKYLKAMYENDLAESAVATAKAVHDGGHAANYLFDSDLRTCWLAPEAEAFGEIEVSLDGQQTFNVIKLQENIVDFGQRVAAFEVDAWKNGAWVTIGEATTIGIRRLLRVSETTTDRLRIRITKSRTSPSLATLALFNAPKLVPGPDISRDGNGKVTIQGNGAPIKYTVDGSSPFGKDVLDYTGAFDLPLGGQVTAITVSGNREEWVLESVADYGIVAKDWKARGGRDAKHLIDGDPETTASFDLGERSGNCFEIDFPGAMDISGFGYLPPQGSPEEPGRIETYTLLGKLEDGTWEKLYSGKFGNIDNNPLERRVHFQTKSRVKAVRFQINSATREQKSARVAEFILYNL